jgi:probable selenium-dependent hydroxylase accessory protein YqeC
MCGRKLSGGGVVCFTGGGGKTTLMLNLARRLGRRYPVIVTATTRMATSEVEPSNVLLGDVDAAEVKNKIVTRGYVFLFKKRNEEKYIGFDPEVVASFHSRKWAAYVLAEGTHLPHGLVSFLLGGRSFYVMAPPPVH